MLATASGTSLKGFASPGGGIAERLHRNWGDGDAAERLLFI